MLNATCLSDLGQANVSGIAFISDIRLIRSMLDRTHEFVQILDAEKEFPVDHYHNLLPVLKKIRPEGTFMELSELVELKLSLESIKAVVNYFKGEEAELYPELKKMASGVKLYPFVTESINKIVTGKGKIKDNASPELAKIRKSLKEKAARVSSRMHSILRKAREDGLVDEDTELSVRNGRMVIPLRAADKRKIHGLVHDESATGKTTYVEPAEIVELNNDIRELEYAEKREIIRILIESNIGGLDEFLSAGLKRRKPLVYASQPVGDPADHLFGALEWGPLGQQQAGLDDISVELGKRLKFEDAAP